MDVEQAVLAHLKELSTASRPIYLVGGAVRDRFMSRPVHDLDFAMPGPTRSIAANLADRMGGALYVLDEQRHTTRVILSTEHGRIVIDFAALRGSSIIEDLRARDFTINAMGFDVDKPDVLIDPTGGLQDLRDKVIRLCSPSSLSDDPVRIIRAVRQALTFHYRIVPDTIQSMHSSVGLLQKVSEERKRDELVRILESGQAALGLRLLDQVGALQQILPELRRLKDMPLSGMHVSNAWEHAIAVVHHLEQLLPPLVGHYRRDSVADLSIGSAVLWLGRYREHFARHFQSNLVPDRSPRALLLLAALYQNIALEPVIDHQQSQQRLSHYAAASASTAAECAKRMAFSSDEVNRVETIVSHHLLVHALAEEYVPGKTEPLARRTIYRFFQAVGKAAVEICFLSLADLRASFGPVLPQDLWEAELAVCRSLLEAYWERAEDIISPPRLVTGDDLMTALSLKPGRQVGKILEAIREEQAAGEIYEREQALDFARRWLDHPKND